MKHTIKVFIASLAFNIVASAYKKVKNYLNNLEESLADSDSAKEAVDEIERKIADLLKEKSKNAEVVDEKMVDSVIEIIDESKTEIIEQSSKKEVLGKKLFRNTKEKVIAGVCSGISDYWGVDTVLIRVLFIAISIIVSIYFPRINFPYFLFAYILLWIIIPEAKTPLDRKRMLARNKKNPKNNNKETIPIIRFFSLIIGISLIIITLVCLVSILLCSIGIVGFPSALISSLSGMVGSVGLVAVSLVIAIPLLLLLYWGILLTFNINKPSWKAGLWTLPLWVLSIVICIIKIVGIGTQYTNSERLRSESVFETPSELVINVEGADKEYDYAYYKGDTCDYQLHIIVNKTLYSYPTIHIERKDNAHLKIKSSTTKFKNAEEDVEFYSYSNDTLTLRPMVFNKDIKTKHLCDDIIIELPSDCEIKLNSIRSHDFKSVQNYSNVFGWPRRL